jgi:hypothetical protein
MNETLPSLGGVKSLCCNGKLKRCSLPRNLRRTEVTPMPVASVERLRQLGFV